MVDVSVVVIVYNDEKRLPTAVQSVLNQALRSVEAVIVDDHSSDGSFAVARDSRNATPTGSAHSACPPTAEAADNPATTALNGLRAAM